MKQRVKILESNSPDELEEKINEFLEEYEIRGIQLVTTVLKDPYTDPICYTALIKYQVLDEDELKQQEFIKESDKLAEEQGLPF